MLEQVEANVQTMESTPRSESDRQRSADVRTSPSALIAVHSRMLHVLQKRRKASEVDLEQGTFVASLDSSTGKIRLTRAKQPGEKLTQSTNGASTRAPSAPATPLASSSSQISTVSITNSAAEDNTPATPVIKRLKLKLGGESIS